MDNLLKSQHPIVEAEAYEPPCMTVVPIRISGMLMGSAPIERMQAYTFDDDFSSYFQESYDDGFSSESFGTASDWGDSFF